MAAGGFSLIIGGAGISNIGRCRHSIGGKMFSLSSYARVSRLSLELAIEQFVDDEKERAEIEALCLPAMSKKPVGFVHAADILRARGHNDIVHYCLSQAARG